MIDEVVVTHGHQEGLDFEEDFLRLRPDFLIATEDDEYGGVKRELCARVGAQYAVLPKTPPRFEPANVTTRPGWSISRGIMGASPRLHASLVMARCMPMRRGWRKGCHSIIKRSWMKGCRRCRPSPGRWPTNTAGAATAATRSICLGGVPRNGRRRWPPTPCCVPWNRSAGCEEDDYATH